MIFKTRKQNEDHNVELLIYPEHDTMRATIIFNVNCWIIIVAMNLCTCSIILFDFPADHNNCLVVK